MPAIIHRDTVTGRIVTADYARQHPDTTVREVRSGRYLKQKIAELEKRIIELENQISNMEV